MHESASYQFSKTNDRTFFSALGSVPPFPHGLGGSGMASREEGYWIDYTPCGVSKYVDSIYTRGIQHCYRNDIGRSRNAAETALECFRKERKQPSNSAADYTCFT